MRRIKERAKQSRFYSPHLLFFKTLPVVFFLQILLMKQTEEKWLGYCIVSSPRTTPSIPFTIILNEIK